MKILRQLGAACAATFLLSVVALAASDDSHGHAKKSDWPKLFGDASPALIWQSVLAATEKIEAAAAAKSMDGMKDWSKTAFFGLHALQEKVKQPDANRQKRLEAALTQAARIADSLVEAAYHKEADKVPAAMARLKSALQLIALRLPEEITSARAETPRFNKSSK